MAEKQNRSGGSRDGSRSSGRQSGASKQSSSRSGGGAKQESRGETGSPARGTERERDTKLNPQDEVEVDIEPVSEQEFIEDVEEQEDEEKKR